MFFLASNSKLGRSMSASNSILRKGISALNSMLDLDVSAPNPTLGLDMSMPNPMLVQGRDHTQLHVGLWHDHPWPFLGIVTSWTRLLLGSGCELNPMSLRLSTRLKSHSTLSLLYPESELIIMMPIIILLNTNKQFMITLIKCNGTSNKIIISYLYEIIFLPLLRCMRQFKSSNIKENMNIQKKDRYTQ